MFNAGDKVEIRREKFGWGKTVVGGRVEQVTDVLYVVRLWQGWCECFIKSDPDIYMRKAAG